ncbi:MAG: RNA polymerase factor sigma-54 [Bacteroidaceae bacterium]|nr:RNA polymerase factor sigma-54 [Bacteroidaceae bacterium]
MSQKLTLTQTQTQRQTQEQRLWLTPQQLLAAKLTSLSLDELRERVEAECMENPWLEKRRSTRTKQSRSSLSYDVGERGDTQSFYDSLTEQMGEYDLTEEERQILEYLIGSLDDSGFITKPIHQIVDELEIYHSIPTSEREVSRLLGVLQQFDPPGIGARNLKECLLLQHPSEKLRSVFENCWDDFTGKRWDRIQERMHLTDLEVEHLRREVQRLNPRPGGNLNDVMDRQMQTIKPDFIVEIDEEGVIHLSLNQGDVPSVKVSEELPSEEGEGESASFVRTYKEKGQQFVDALAQRRQTLLTVMKTIIRLQKAFFVEGDEALLRPMRLEDVAEKTGLDLSTVSRVTSSKYVETPYGMYPLKWFFSGSSVQDGEEVSVRKVKQALQELIGAEDKTAPLSDDRLCALLREQGYEIARRTVAKYREALGFPPARLRR